MDKLRQQTWLFSPRFDLVFLIAPPFASILLVFLFPSIFQQQETMSDIFWLMVVVFIDVSHVYSTLFKTYFNKSNFEQHRQLYLTVPIICYVAGVLIHSGGAGFYWRVLAYLAVFHFVRQQYGFFRLYGRSEKPSQWEYYLDNTTIYLATIYPMFYWHTHPETPFNWFVENDFVLIPASFVSTMAGWLYLSILCIYSIKEIFKLYYFKNFNLPKNLILAGTASSWYLSIVYFKSDIAFTTINVIAHGIPYMGLIFAEGKKEPTTDAMLRFTFRKSYGIVFFLLILFGFSYLEEGFWDALVWNEHQLIFPFFHSFIPFINDKNLLTLTVPLLSLPQTSHYVLDGFIWRKGK